MIKAIVAMSAQRIIGKDNRVPWQNKEDLAHFKQTTSGHSVVMGRKTFESIGRKPLPHRKNYVLTTNKEYIVGDGVLLVHDYKDLVSEYEKSEQTLFVIGGAEIYNVFLPYCSQIIISIIPGQYEGDTFFPEFESQFHLLENKTQSSFELRIYERG